MQAITLVWDANPDPELAGYVLYAGTNSGEYYTRSFIGNVTSYELSDLLKGVDYFFAVTTRTLDEMESDFSNEVPVRLALSNAPTVTAISDVFTGLGGSTDPIPFTVNDLEIPAWKLSVSATSSNPSLVPSCGITFSGSDSNRFVTIEPDATKMGVAEISIFVSNGDFVTTNTFILNVGGGTPVPADFWMTPGGFKLSWASYPWSIFRGFYKTNLSDLAWSQASLDLVSLGLTTSWTDPTVRQSTARFYKVYKIE
jgi:hypothetical protein